MQWELQLTSHGRSYPNYIFLCLVRWNLLNAKLCRLFFFFDTENATIMVTKPRIVPPALTLGPEVNLLTEFALIATSPQSPLVREVSGENADSRRREGDSPPPQLVDPKKMVCDRGLGMSQACSSSFFPSRSRLCVKYVWDFRFSAVCNVWFHYQREVELLWEVVLNTKF